MNENENEDVHDYEIPYGWIAYFDPNSGNPFYYNIEHRIKTWNKSDLYDNGDVEPPEEEEDDEVNRINFADFADYADSSISASTASSTVTAAAAWVQYIDEFSGKPFYYHAQKNIKLWDINEVMAANNANKQKRLKITLHQPEEKEEIVAEEEIVVEEEQKEHRNEMPGKNNRNEEKSEPLLASGWEEYIDPSSGDHYYCNEAKNIKTWHRREALGGYIFNELEISPCSTAPTIEMAPEKTKMLSSSDELLRLNIFSTTVQKMIVIQRLTENDSKLNTTQFKELYYSTVNDPSTDPNTNTLVMIAISKLLFQNKYTINMNDNEIIDMQEALLRTTIRSQKELFKVMRLMKGKNSNEAYAAMIDCDDDDIESKSLASSTLYEEILKEKIEKERNLKKELLEEEQAQKDEATEHQHTTFAAGMARRVARNPKTYFWINFVICVALSVFALMNGNLSIEADNRGFFSRGTEIADQYAQIYLLRFFRAKLFITKSEENWLEVTTVIQPGWQTRSLREIDVDDNGSSNDGRNNFLFTEQEEEEHFLPRTMNSKLSLPSSASSLLFDVGTEQNDLHLLFGNNDKHKYDIDIDIDMIMDRHNPYGKGNIDYHEKFLQMLPTNHSDHHTQIFSNLQINKSHRDLQSENIVNELSEEYEEQIKNGTFNMWLLTCDWDWYSSGDMLRKYGTLWPVWKVTKPSNPGSSPPSALDGDVIREICIAEENTQKVLEENGLCFGCDNGKCLPPYSIVLYARLLVPGGVVMDCATLGNTWDADQELVEETKKTWYECLDDIGLKGIQELDRLPVSCGEVFFPSIVDQFFRTEGVIAYTSSIFATTDAAKLYKINEQFDRGGNSGGIIQGVYETRGRDFASIFGNIAIIYDIMLGFISGCITILAILIHTGSPLLTLVGIIEIMFSFPIAYLLYYFVGQLEFFPFLNYIGIFVAFALGADHIFVAVDKWKNTRIKYPRLSTEEIAAIALPDAAGAMFLTTTTTAIAFFFTAICRVAPIRVFAIFCGLLVVVDYIIDILLIFPCLCIYDSNRATATCFISFCLRCNVSACCCCKKSRGDEAGEIKQREEEEKENSNMDLTNGDEQKIIIVSHENQQQESTIDGNNDNASPGINKMSLIHRILRGYYKLLHRFRYMLLLLSMASLATCIYFATQLPLPSSTDVVLLGEDVEYEKHFGWRQDIVLEQLIYKEAFAQTFVVWGLLPADTGDLNSPYSWTQMVLDDTFDPSTPDAQIYLRDFCTDLFQEEFAIKPSLDYRCAMNEFDDWLKDQDMFTKFAPMSVDKVYTKHCANAARLPISDDIFHPCIINWSRKKRVANILARDGIVTIIDISFTGRALANSPNRELYREWNLVNDWMVAKKANAPPEVEQHFFGSIPFWLHDTQNDMFTTAYLAGAGALTIAAIVILFYSRSITITIFSVFSIAYILVSVTSMIYSIGWSLGFLESICFSILIGISVDYVIHLCHAYVSVPGSNKNVPRTERTKFALLSMGPSILAAALTTISSSIFMLFTEILFFRKFGIILTFTVIQAVIGSFVVFLTLTDIFGPSNPTHTYDQMMGYIACCMDKKKTNEKALVSVRS